MVSHKHTTSRTLESELEEDGFESLEELLNLESLDEELDFEDDVAEAEGDDAVAEAVLLEPLWSLTRVCLFELSLLWLPLWCLFFFMPWWCEPEVERDESTMTVFVTIFSTVTVTWLACRECEKVWTEWSRWYLTLQSLESFELFELWELLELLDMFELLDSFELLDLFESLDMCELLDLSLLLELFDWWLLDDLSLLFDDPVCLELRAVVVLEIVTVEVECAMLLLLLCSEFLLDALDLQAV
jgi:hypothetical protein